MFLFYNDVIEFYAVEFSLFNGMNDKAKQRDNILRENESITATFVPLIFSLVSILAAS